MAKKGSSGHLLVIRLSAMGDVAMLVPVILALVKKYPEIKITLLTRARFAPIFKDIEAVEVFEAEVKGKHKGLVGLYRLFRQLKKEGITAVADTHNVLRSSILKVFFSFTGVPYVQLDKGRTEKKQLTSTNNKRFQQLKTTHQRYVDVFTKLGYPIKLSSNDILEPTALSTENLGIVKDKILIGIAPFAAYKGKTYPLQKVREVIGSLVTVENVQVVLFGGGKNEVDQLNELALGFGEMVINLAGKLPFKEELDVISNLHLMLAMDSGNGHLAANYGIPVVTLWGVTHPFAGFTPFNQVTENSLCADRKQYPLVPTSIYGNNYPESYEQAISSIATEKVVQRITTVLKLNKF